MQKYDSIIFDLDGTLWDAVDSVVEVWNEVLKDVGLEPSMDYQKLSRCMGLLINQIVETLIPDATPEQTEKIIAECAKREIGMLSKLGGKLYDGVEQVLGSLSGKYRLFVVSNCQDGYIQAFFSAHGLRKYFTDYECAGRTGREKCYNIEKVVKEYRLKSPVYVGDTASDCEAAAKAGIPFIFASYGFGNTDIYDECAESFYDLQRIFLD